MTSIEPASRATGDAQATWSTVGIRRVVGLLAAARRWRQYRRQMRALAALDDRLLEDVGLTRRSVQREIIRVSERNHVQLGTAAIAALLLIAIAPPTSADTVRVLSAAAVQTVLPLVRDDFERSSGHKLVITYATMGAIDQRVRAGESVDIVIGSTASMQALVAADRIRPETVVQIAKVGVGVVMPAGSAVPPINTPTQLSRALLAAKTVLFANPSGGGAAGIHVAKVIEELNLAERLAPKVRLGAGGDITEVTLSLGDGALGLTQISEIVGKRDAVFVGPLPTELQNYTGVSVGIPFTTEPTPAMRSFVQFLRSFPAAAAMKAKGLEPI